MGNSGTSMRLLSGCCRAALPGTLIGDASLSRRPMRRVTDAAGQHGGAHRYLEHRAPRRCTSRQRRSWSASTIAMPVASAQVKSSLLLAGLYADGETCVSEPAPTRDHTERMLTALGYAVRRDGAASA
jgi:3-phosphoshikimate 1-carboxyvinyltransferase